MRKKTIEVTLANRPSIAKPFAQWLQRMQDEEDEEYRRMIEKYGSEAAYYRALWEEATNQKYGHYDDYDDDEDDVYGVYGQTNHQTVINDDDDIPNKRIFFYTNYADETTQVEFNSLQEFSDYCTENGYEISDSDAMDIAYCDEYHCALSPYETTRSVVVGAEYYDDMLYRCRELEYYKDMDEEDSDYRFSTTW